LKILMVNYEYPPLGGGGGTVMAQLAEGLAGRGHEVQVLTSRHRGGTPAETRNGVRIHRVPVLFRHRLDVATQVSMYSFLPSGYWGGVQRIDPEQVDLINTHFAVPSGPTGVLLSRKWNKPHVLTTHGGDIYDPSKKLSPHRFYPLKKIVQWVLNHSRKVTTDYNDIAQRTRQIYGYSGPQEVIPFGLPEIPVIQPDRQILGWEEDVPVLISVARVIPRKGFRYLVEALGQLKGKKWRWVLVGSGPLIPQLQKQAWDLGIGQRIHFAGFVPEEEKYRMLACADIFVLPSLHEGFGVVNLEAMAFGLPIITTRVGGQTDFLEDRENALLVQPADIHQLKGALSTLLENNTLRKQMQDANRRDIRKYTLEHTLDEYEKIFVETLEEFQ
jgi:L-malate glycosyltransferase